MFVSIGSSQAEPPHRRENSSIRCQHRSHALFSACPMHPATVLQSFESRYLPLVVAKNPDRDGFLQRFRLIISSGLICDIRKKAFVLEKVLCFVQIALPCFTPRKEGHQQGARIEAEYYRGPRNYQYYGPAFQMEL